MELAPFGQCNPTGWSVMNRVASAENHYPYSYPDSCCDSKTTRVGGKIPGND